jgi:hypothetical protein
MRFTRIALLVTVALFGMTVHAQHGQPVEHVDDPGGAIVVAAHKDSARTGDRYQQEDYMLQAQNALTNYRFNLGRLQTLAHETEQDRSAGYKRAVESFREEEQELRRLLSEAKRPMTATEQRANKREVNRALDGVATAYEKVLRFVR